MNKEMRTAEILSLVGCMDVLISIRLHALVFASIMDVPMIGISYDPKIERFLDSISEKPLAKLDDVTADKIFDETLKKLRADKKLQAKSHKLQAELHKLAVKTARLAIELLNK